MKHLIYFYTITCAPCKILKPFLDQLEKAGTKVVHIDAENPDHQSKVSAFNIQAVPTVILVENDIALCAVIGSVGKIMESVREFLA